MKVINNTFKKVQNALVRMSEKISRTSTRHQHVLKSTRDEHAGCINMSALNIKDVYSYMHKAH